MTFSWDNGIAGPAAAYSWTVPGSYTIIVTTTNPCGTTWEMLQVEVRPYNVYLPLVLRGW